MTDSKEIEFSDFPVVAGRMVEGSLDDLERRSQLYIHKEQAGISPNNGLIAVLCDTIRLCREYADNATHRQPNEATSKGCGK